MIEEKDYINIANNLDKIMPKIVHFTRLFFPHIGGVETHIEKLNEQLKADGHDLVVITAKHDLDLVSFEKRNNESIYRLNVLDSGRGMNYKLQIWNEIWKLKKVWLGADIIHIHDVFFWILPFLPLISKKTFITFHGYEGNELPNWKSKFWHEVASILTKGNICIGNFHQKWYSVIPTFVSFGAVQSIKVPKNKRKSSELIYVGRLEEDNGLMIILGAIKKLKDNGKKYHLDVYGEGSLERKAKDFVIKYQLDIKFHGFHPQARMFVAQYKVAFVSRYLSILDALSTETHVISYSHNRLSDDYLKDTPFVDWISVIKNQDEIVSVLEQDKSFHPKAKKWALEQNWQQLKNTYLKLWAN